MTQQTEIECQAVLDISGVSAWLEQAIALLETRTQTPVCLNANAVQRIDTAGLQALLMLFKTAHDQHVELKWHAPSGALRQAAKLTGLEQALQLA